MFYRPLLIPLLALVFLTFLVWVFMYVTRLAEIKRKSIDPQSLDTRVHGQTLLTDSPAQADNLKNLFELPVLFYVAVLLALVLMIQDQLIAHTTGSCIVSPPMRQAAWSSCSCGPGWPATY
jgi:hypothetical protein